MSTNDNAGEESRGVWRQHSRQWAQVGSPLRPSPEDGELLMALAAPFLGAQQGGGRVAVLGVTPEVVQLPWPQDAQVVALDHSAEMIRNVWRPHAYAASCVMQARWESIPLESNSVDVAAGDGSLNNLVDLASYAAVAAEIARVLKPGGALVLRCFVRPDGRESIEAIAGAVWRGDVSGFHALKWRLAMLITEEATASVPVSHIRDLFEATFPDRDALAAATGWPRSAIDTIDAYRAQATRYTFPTLEQFRAGVAPCLALREVRAASYELGERCPTLLFRAN